MADQLQYQLQLIDQLSGPVSQEIKAISALEKQLFSAKASLKSYEAQQLSMAKRAAGDDPTKLARLKLAEDKKLALERIKIAERQIAEAKKVEAAEVASAKKIAAQQAKAAEAAMAQAKKAEKVQADAARKQYLMQRKFEDATLKFKADKQAKDLAASTAQVEAIGGVYAAAAAAALGLAVAVGSLTIAGASLAIEASEAKNDTLDMLDAMLGSQEAAESTYAAIDDITRDMAISQARGTELARALTAAGVTSASALTDAIKSIGEVESVIGDQAGGKIQNIIERAAQTGKFQLSAKQLTGTGVQVQQLYENIAKRTGKGVKAVEAALKAGKISAEVGIAALTETIDTKFGGVAAKQALDFGAQMQRLKDNFGKLFEDVDTGPFLTALDKIVKLFDQSTPAGKALHDTFTSIFNGLFKAVAAVAPYVTTFLKGLIIIGLRIYIAMKPMLRQFGMLGDQTDGAQSLADTMSDIGVAVAKVVSAVVKFFGYTPLWDPLTAAIGFAWDILVGFVDTQIWLVGAIGDVASAIGDAIAWLLDLGSTALQAGSDLVHGLIDGVLNTAAEFIDTIKNVGLDGLAAFKSVFDSHSPSRVMMGEGADLMLGLVKGIDANAPAANDTLANAVSPPAISNVSSQSTTGGSLTITVAPGAIVINGSGLSSQELESMMTNVLTNVIERAALQAGVDPKAA